MYTVYYLHVPDHLLYSLTGIKRQLIIFLQTISKKFDLISIFILYTNSFFFYVSLLTVLFTSVSLVCSSFIFLHFFLIFISV